MLTKDFSMSALHRYFDETKHEHGVETTPYAAVSLEDRLAVSELIDEVAEERASMERHMADLSVAQHEVEMHVTQIEKQCDVLRFGLEHHKYDVQALALVTSSLEDYHGIIGEDVVVPALEGHSDEDLHRAYEVSLEGLGTVLNRMKEVLGRSLKSVATALVELGTNEKAARIINTRADEVLGRNNIPDAVETTLKGSHARMVSLGGSVVDDIPKALKADVKMFEQIIAKFIPAATKYGETLLEQYANAAMSTDPGDALKKMLDAPMPFTAIPSAAFTEKGLLGVKVHVSDPRREIVMSDRFRRHARIIGSFSLDAVRTEPTSVSLSATDMKAMLETAKLYATLLQRLSTSMMRELRQERNWLQRQVNRQTPGEREVTTYHRNNDPSERSRMERHTETARDERAMVLEAALMVISRSAGLPIHAHNLLSSHLEWKAGRLIAFVDGYTR